MRGPNITSIYRCRPFFLSTFLIAVLPMTSAFALDCKLAATKPEKAICADPGALAADADLGRAYESLRTSVSAGQRGELSKAQSHWLSARDANCDEKSGDTLSVCLADETKKRTKFLMGAPDAGAGGAGKLVPFFRIEKGGAGRTDVDVEVFKFTSPTTAAQRAFNSTVDKLIGNIAQPDKGDTTTDFSFSAYMTLAYVSPRLLSAQTVTSTFLGGAHPMTEISNINIDVAAGREATFASLLDKKSAQDVFKLCAAQVLQQKKEREGADADVSADAVQTLEKTVSDISGDLTLWSFNADKAVVTYSADMVGAHAEGVFDCTIPYAGLRKMAKASFPLP